jgi:hypothetical protein
MLVTALPLNNIEINVFTLTEITNNTNQWLNDIRLIKANSEDYETALAGHMKWWSKFWDRSWIEILTTSTRYPIYFPKNISNKFTLIFPPLGTLFFLPPKYFSNYPSITPEDAFTVTQNYLLQRHMDACSGRGHYPIKFNGLIFTVDLYMDGEYLDPDFREWGGTPIRYL